MAKGSRRPPNRMQRRAAKFGSLSQPNPAPEPLRSSETPLPEKNRLRNQIALAEAKLAKSNAWLAEKLNISRAHLLEAEIGGLAVWGFTMMQIGEWAIAILCWFLLGFILLIKAVSWKPVKFSAYRRFVKSMAVVGALASFVILTMVTTLRKPDSEPWSNLEKLFACASVEVNSEIVADVHSRAMWLPSGQTEVYKPVFQDLFHDWTIKVVPLIGSPTVLVSVRDMRRPDDRIRTIPEGAEISEPKPQWFSGFDEPSHAPDFYVRTIKFESLRSPATIIIRRPIKSQAGINSISAIDLDLDRTVSATAEGGLKVSLKPLSTDKFPLTSNTPHFQQLITELHALLAQHVVGGPVGTRLNPDEPYPPLQVHESEMVSEVKCQDVSCSKMLVEMKEHSRIQ